MENKMEKNEALPQTSATADERKNKALDLMAELEIYKPYINDFRRAGTRKVCFYENFAGFWVYQKEDLLAKIKELETKRNATVYAVTHEYTQYGEMYDLMFVPDDRDAWNELVVDSGYKHHRYVYAYTWNVTDDALSEFGYVTVQLFGGGLRRVG